MTRRRPPPRLESTADELDAAILAAPIAARRPFDAADLPLPDDHDDWPHVAPPHAVILALSAEVHRLRDRLRAAEGDAHRAHHHVRAFTAAAAHVVAVAEELDPVTAPYYQDDAVTIYHGDARDVLAWLAADVLVTDPPYGRAWRQGAIPRSGSHAGIAGDSDTATRDAVLYLWGDRPAVMFGDLMLAPPDRTRQVLVYGKPPDAGVRGATAGFRRDLEAIYLCGPWPSGLGGRSSLIATREPCQGNPSSPAGRYGHPHAKPLDVMGHLLRACPSGVVADPFLGSGTTLVAAKAIGRHAIGVELEERYCERAARRLSQEVLPL